jgi:hypothetical protein
VGEPVKEAGLLHHHGPGTTRDFGKSHLPCCWAQASSVLCRAARLPGTAVLLIPRLTPGSMKVSVLHALVGNYFLLESSV